MKHTRTELQEPLDETHRQCMIAKREIKTLFRKKRREKWAEGALMAQRFEERLAKYDGTTDSSEV